MDQVFWCVLEWNGRVFGSECVIEKRRQTVAHGRARLWSARNRCRRVRCPDWGVATHRRDRLTPP